MQKFDVKNQSETEKIAEDLAKLLAKQDQFFIAAEGTLGAGKTTFIRSFIAAYFKEIGEAGPSHIPSPTYNIVRTYGESPKHQIAHMDLYRISSLKELEAIGYETYFYGMRGCLCEWLSLIPEAQSILPSYAVQVSLEILDENRRTITIRSS